MIRVGPWGLPRRALGGRSLGRSQRSLSAWPPARSVGFGPIGMWKTRCLPAVSPIWHSTAAKNKHSRRQLQAPPAATAASMSDDALVSASELALGSAAPNARRDGRSDPSVSAERGRASNRELPGRYVFQPVKLVVFPTFPWFLRPIGPDPFFMGGRSAEMRIQRSRGR